MFVNKYLRYTVFGNVTIASHSGIRQHLIDSSNSQCIFFLFSEASTEHSNNYGDISQGVTARSKGA